MMMIKISVLKVRQLKKRSCQLAAPTSQAQLQKAAELLKLKLKMLKMQKSKIKNSFGKTTVTKRTPQESEIQSKKLCPVDNNLSPNKPLIEFFNMFCDNDFIDAVVYQSKLYNI